VEIKRFKISEDVLAEVVKYLTTKPYQEVSTLVMAIQKDVEFLAVEDLERPIDINKTESKDEEEVEEEMVEKKPSAKKKKK
jgi:hypothetical protein